MGVARIKWTVSANELNNWIAGYSATAVCCGFAAVPPFVTVGIEVCGEHDRRDVHGLKSALTFGPKLWRRWQSAVFSTPVTSSPLRAGDHGLSPRPVPKLREWQTAADAKCVSVYT